MDRLLYEVLNGKITQVPPLWIMRQAGRYLPEYRALRVKAGSFWAICRTPGMAAEVSLQPVKRFGFDAAIIFSDILLVPAALGMAVSFGDGPKLEPVESVENLGRSKELWQRTVEPVYEAVGLTRARLDKNKSLLGFAGGPWTLAVYMAGGGSETKPAILWSYRDPEGFERLIELLTDSVCRHLIGQLEAGADTVQIFESAAGGLTQSAFSRWVVKPTAKIAAKLRAAMPQAKIIGFPRGASLLGYEAYTQESGVDAVSLDTAVPIAWAVDALGTKAALQGNLDPLALLAGGKALEDAVDAILQATRGKRHIFNLGHGILPDTPLEHVEQLVHLVRSVR